MRRQRVPLLAVLLIVATLLTVLSARSSDAAGGPLGGSADPGSRFITEPVLRALLDESPWPAYLHDAVVYVARCESGLRDLSIMLMDTQALHVSEREHSVGLMQINTKIYDRLAESLDLTDAADNLIGAYIVWLDNGKTFEPWSCAPPGTRR